MLTYYILSLLLSLIFSCNRSTTSGTSCHTYEVTTSDITSYKEPHPSENTGDYYCCFVHANFVVEGEIKECHAFYKGHIDNNNVMNTISMIERAEYDFYENKADVISLDCGAEWKNVGYIVIILVVLLGL